MLAAVSVGPVFHDAHLAIIGLDEDASLWNSAASVSAQMTERDRLLLRRWTQVIETLRGSSLESFAALFNERYLDTTPLVRSQHPHQLRRSTVGRPDQRTWNLVRTQERPRPTEATAGDQQEWSTWLPSVWRVLSDPARTLTVPTHPPTDFDGALGWWTPLVHLMVYSLGWQSPAQGLTAWHSAGRPIDDARLSLIEAIWGRNLDAMIDHLWNGCGNYEREVASQLRLAPVERPSTAPERSAATAASTVTSNPATGGCDPLHLSLHYSTPLDGYSAGFASILKGDPGIGGPARALLRCASYSGWYRALHELANELPGDPKVMAGGWT